jgi:hypothetical protein
VYCQQASGVTLRNSEVAWGANRPDYFGYALEAHAVSDLRLEGFRGAAAYPDRDQAIHVDDRPEP